MKPIIGITTYGRYEKDLANPYYEYHFSLPALYIDALRRAGGLPFLITPGESDWEQVMATVDGLVISGGADIDPRRYGGDPSHPKLTRLDPERDEMELGLIRFLTDVTPAPTLCICRGMQVLNVALGGTLHEHVADVYPEDVHRSDDGGWTVQPVEVRPSSRLAEIMGATEVATYSGHHQGVKELAAPLQVVATASDGIVEAVEHPGVPWLVGVQWHPEITAADDPTQQRLFDELVAEAARVRAKRVRR